MKRSVSVLAIVGLDGGGGVTVLVGARVRNEETSHVVCQLCSGFSVAVTTCLDTQEDYNNSLSGSNSGACRFCAVFNIRISWDFYFT